MSTVFMPNPITQPMTGLSKSTTRYKVVAARNNYLLEDCERLTTGCDLLPLL
jgi:hypothetical protein